MAFASQAIALHHETSAVLWQKPKTYAQYLYELQKNSYTNSTRVCIRTHFGFVYEKFWNSRSFHQKPLELLKPLEPLEP